MQLKTQLRTPNLTAAAIGAPSDATYAAIRDKLENEEPLSDEEKQIARALGWLKATARQVLDEGVAKPVGRLVVR